MLFEFSMEEQDINQDQFMTFNNQNEFDIVSLFYIEEFHLSRIYIKKNENFTSEILEKPLFMYLARGNEVHRINL